MSLPPRLVEVVDDFAALSPRDRLDLLLEYADGLPDLPERFEEHPELLERVPECQTPLFLTVETGPEPDARVDLFFSAPREAPTTRGFAGVLHAALDGEPADVVLSVPVTVLEDLRLSEVVSPLRMRGMASMLIRIQNKVRGARRVDPGREPSAAPPRSSS
jgi:cysteine desulfuration protein SufE